MAGFQLQGTRGADPHQPVETAGFTVNGCFAAMNQVVVERDWYTKGSGYTATARAAHYNTTTGQWVDALTGTVLTSYEALSNDYQL
jgi:hypothetical protein